MTEPHAAAWRGLAAIFCAFLATGCSTLSGVGGGDATAALLANLRGCERTYIGSLAGLGPPAASVSIRCQPEADAGQAAAIAEAVKAEVARALGGAVPADDPAVELEAGP
jgi:hypothetical protein